MVYTDLDSLLVGVGCSRLVHREQYLRLPATLILSLLLLLGPACAHFEQPLPQGPRIEVTEEGTGHGKPYVKLVFRPLLREVARERLTAEEARAFVESMEDALEKPEWRALLGVSHPGVPASSLSEIPPGTGEQWRHILKEYATLYGSSNQPLPEILPDDKFATALILSTRYMPEGVRAGAEELFSSRTVIMAVIVAGLTYLTLWLAPDPVFTKSAATMVTVGLMALYGVTEIINVAKAFMRFYRDVSAATTLEELEAAARHFGESMGKVGVRIMAMVAGGAMSRALPKSSLPSPGSLWPPQRVVAMTAEGAEVEMALSAGTSTLVEVSTSTAVLMGVSTTTAATAGLAAMSSARTTGDCRPESNKGDARRHHIATDKNEISNATGGPWTPRFRDLFTKAGMDLDDPANIVFLIAHEGPHPQKYHEAVYLRLADAVEDCASRSECRQRLVSELDRLAADICKPGSSLNRLATRKP